MSQERIEDSVDTPWWGEHENRYDEALRYLGKGIKILDIACGTGFGTFKLYQNGANNVTGGDISEEALIYCHEKYKDHIHKNHFDFLNLDATALAFGDKTFDVIVSFETIEHIGDYKKVILEFGRILKDNGILILSTPNSAVTSPGGKIINPFHVQEFTYLQLKEILGSTFRDCAIGGQQYIRYKKKQNRMAHLVENIFYMRGVRRLSLGIRDAIMQKFGLPQFYPVSNDYEITYEMDELLKCVTLFAVCRK